jgi:hypothetical protein
MMPKWPSRSWIPVLIVLLMLIVGLRGYVTDDTWIHLRYAQNLLELGEFSFNPGEHTYGATSPLWIFGLALLLKLGVAPLLATKMMGVGSLLLLMVIAGWIMRRLDLPKAWWPWAMLVVIFDAWLQRWAMSGMETPLATALLLALLMPVFAVRVSWVAVGAIAALAALTRPEFTLLGPAAVLWLIFFRAQGWRRLTALLQVAVGWLALLGPWWYYAWQVFGRVTPETAAAKSYGIDFSPMPLLTHLARSITQLGAVHAFLWLGFILVVLVWWRTLSGCRKAAAEDQELQKTMAKRSPPMRGLWVLTGIVLSWTVVLLGGYAVKQVWIISRYLSPLLPSLLMVLTGWTWWMIRDRDFMLGERWYAVRRVGRVRSIVMICVTLYLASNAIMLNLQIRPHSIKFSRGVENCFYGMGEWLNKNTPPDAVIAAHDIGALGYASERRILDLAGLVSPEILEIGRQVGFEAMVASGAWLKVEVPDYVYDRTNGEPRWDGVTLEGVHFRLIATCDVEGVGLREQQVMTYALYKLTR